MSAIKFPVGIALANVPVNILPLVAKSDGTTINASVAYNAAGMDLNWNFVTADGTFTQTNVTPTTAGSHDWNNEGNGMYSIEMTATGGTINNDTIGFGWFSGETTAEMAWRGPICEFGLDVVLGTTIATRASQTSFTLTAGSADNDAYNGWLCVIRDSAGTAQRGLGVVSDYVGNTRTVTIDTDTFGFTTAAGDYVILIPQPFSLTTQQKANVNAEADQAITDAALATAAALAVVDANVDTLVSPYITGATAGTPSTTSTNTNLTGYADEELVGRTIIFVGGTADGQSRRIATYTETSGVITYDTLTTAPAASDLFVII